MRLTLSLSVSSGVLFFFVLRVLRFAGASSCESDSSGVGDMVGDVAADGDPVAASFLRARPATDLRAAFSEFFVGAASSDMTMVLSGAMTGLLDETTLPIISHCECPK